MKQSLDPCGPPRLGGDVRAVTSLPIVAPLLFLELAIDFRHVVGHCFGASGLFAGVFQLVKTLPDSAHRDLGEIEMRLLVLKQLCIPSNGAGLLGLPDIS